MWASGARVKWVKKCRIGAFQRNDQSSGGVISTQERSPGALITVISDEAKMYSDSLSSLESFSPLECDYAEDAGGTIQRQQEEDRQNGGDRAEKLISCAALLMSSSLA